MHPKKLLKPLLHTLFFTIPLFVLTLGWSAYIGLCTLKPPPPTPPLFFHHADQVDKWRWKVLRPTVVSHWSKTCMPCMTRRTLTCLWSVSSVVIRDNIWYYGSVLSYSLKQTYAMYANLDLKNHGISDIFGLYCGNSNYLSLEPSVLHSNSKAKPKYGHLKRHVVSDLP